MFLDPSSITSPLHLTTALSVPWSHSCHQRKIVAVHKAKNGWGGVSFSENWVYTPLPPHYTTAGNNFNTIVDGNWTRSSKAQSKWWCILVSCFPGSGSYLPQSAVQEHHRFRHQDYNLKQRESRTLDDQGRDQDRRAVSWIWHGPRSTFCGKYEVSHRNTILCLNCFRISLSFLSICSMLVCVMKVRRK